MKIEFTTTAADRLEAQKAEKTVAALWRPAGRARKLLTFLGAVVMFASTWYLGERPTPTRVAGVHPLTVETEAQLLILPGVIMPLCVLWAYVLAAILPLPAERKLVRDFPKPRLRPARSRWEIWRERFLATIAVLGLAGFALMAIVVPIYDKSTDSSVFWLNGGCLVLFQFWIWFALVRFFGGIERRFRSNNFATWLAGMSDWQNVVCEFDDKGLELARAQMRVRYDWSACRRFVETENLYVLTVAYDTMEIIPKRAFATFEDSMKFLALLSDKAGNGFIIKKPGSGFPVQPLGMAVAAPGDASPAIPATSKSPENA